VENGEHSAFWEGSTWPASWTEVLWQLAMLKALNAMLRSFSCALNNCSWKVLRGLLSTLMTLGRSVWPLENG
jgi:hypothetical protein